MFDGFLLALFFLVCQFQPLSHGAIIQALKGYEGYFLSRGKTSFIRKWTTEARRKYGNRYSAGSGALAGVSPTEFP